MKGDKCSYRGCGKKAIGYETHGINLAINVCEDHASAKMKQLKPGYRWGKPEWKEYHYRYTED